MRQFGKRIKVSKPFVRRRVTLRGLLATGLEWFRSTRRARLRILGTAARWIGKNDLGHLVQGRPETIAAIVLASRSRPVPKKGEYPGRGHPARVAFRQRPGITGWPESIDSYPKTIWQPLLVID